jgi:hypothetical protein
MRTDSSFYDNYTHFPTTATKTFMQTHFYRSQESYGYFENNLSWYPNAWSYLNSYGITYGDPIVSQHPEYVMKDVNGNQLYIGYSCNGTNCSRYAGDFTNAGFRSYWIAQHLAILQRGYKGVWLDDVNLDLDAVLPTNGSGTQTAPVDPATHAAMTQSAWEQYFANFLTQYKSTIAGAGYEIQENSVWFEGGRPAGTPSAVQQVIQASSKWLNIERGVTDGGITGGTGDFSLKALFAYIDQVHSLGRYADIQNFNFSQGGGNNDYVPACYFLISTGLDAMGNDAITPNNWPANYDVDLGTPSGSRYNIGSGGIRRDFSRGFVAVTAPGEATTTINLTPGQYKDVAGNPLTTVTIPALSGIIALSTSSPPPASSITFSPTSYTFGSVSTGTTSGAGNVVVTNSGTTTVTFSGVVLGGTNFGDFNITSNTCTGGVNAGATCSVAFTFSPTATGTRTANISFADTANGSPQLVAIQGNGTSSSAGTLTFSNPSWTFGSHPVGQTSGTGHITATNSGTVAVTFTSVVFAGGNSGDFDSTTNTCIGTLAAGANCTDTFNFTPTGTGTRTSNLTFTDSASGSPQVIVVKGSATAAVGSTLTFSNTSWAFGSYTVGSASPSATITITNGTSTANFGTLTPGGTNSSDFSVITNTCTGAIAANATCSTTFSFSPGAVGSRSGSIIYNDDATGSPQTVTLTGTGVAAPPTSGLSFSNPSWTFGSVKVGVNQPSGTIGITNTTASPIAVTSVVFSGTNPGDFPITADTCPTSLGAGAYCSVTFNFFPSAAGSRTANLVWTDGDPTSPQSIPVAGTGIGNFPSLTFSNASWDFGSLILGNTSSTAAFTVTNNGTAVANFTGVTVTGLNPGDFSITANSCTGALAIGASCSVSSIFVPTTTGTRMANVEFADDAPDTPQDIPLQGTGTALPTPVSQPVNAKMTGTASMVGRVIMK